MKLNADALDDPRTQLPPYKYDLYAVTNHTGSLTGGHYTAYCFEVTGCIVMIVV